MREYTVRELRANLKEALDTVSAGEAVNIRRGEETFSIVKHSLLTGPEKNIALSDEKVDTIPTIPDIKERTWQTVLNEITAHENIVKAVDPSNQDPDYWFTITEHKNKIDELWKEYHMLRGKIA